MARAESLVSSSSLIKTAGIYFLYVICLSGVGSGHVSFEECLNSTGAVISEAFCLPSGYRKDVPPTFQTEPINVYVILPLSEISAIDDQHSQISIRLSYKLLWAEPRMILNSSLNWPVRKEKTVAATLIKHFWTPDLIIHDLVQFKKPEVLKEVAALEIKEDLKVYYKIRSDLTIVCKGMEFALYPFDSHVCHLKLTSFTHTTDEMILNGGYTYNPKNQRALPFSIQIDKMVDSDVFVGRSSNYSMYALEIRLRRYVSPYLLSVYLPTGIFVVVSWVSFLIPVDIISARIVLLVTLVLVLINKFNYVTERIPVARQETALEFWVSACVCLVFATFGEYAFILFKVVRLRRQEKNASMYTTVIQQWVQKRDEKAANKAAMIEEMENKVPSVAAVSRNGIRSRVIGMDRMPTNSIAPTLRSDNIRMDDIGVTHHPTQMTANYCSHHRFHQVQDQGVQTNESKLPELKRSRSTRKSQRRSHYRDSLFADMASARLDYGREVDPEMRFKSQRQSQEDVDEGSKAASNASYEWRDTFWKDGIKVDSLAGDSSKSQDDVEEYFAHKRKKFQEEFDEHALTVYPSLFFVFNISYWFYYAIYMQRGT